MLKNFLDFERAILDLEEGVDYFYVYDNAHLEILAGILKSEGLEIGQLIVYEDRDNIFSNTLIQRCKTFLMLKVLEISLLECYAILALGGGAIDYTTFQKNAYLLQQCDPKLLKSLIPISKFWYLSLEELLLAAKNL